MRVLLADDSPPLRERLRARLAEGGHDVIGAVDDGAAAIAAVRELDPDAIVVDVLLRDRQGLELVRALRVAAPRALLVILTNATSYRTYCLALGADLFLDKSAAFDTVAEALSLHRSR